MSVLLCIFSVNTVSQRTANYPTLRSMFADFNSIFKFEKNIKTICNEENVYCVIYPQDTYKH